MGRAEGCRGLSFALEPAEQLLGFALALCSQQFRAHELDGRASRQQTMVRTPDFTHPTLAESFDKLIAAHLACRIELSSQPLHHMGRQRRHDRTNVVWQIQHECLDNR